MGGIKRLIFLSLLVSIRLGLSVIESMMPVSSGTEAKLGLSNIVILITLVIFGFKEALTVGIPKSIVLTPDYRWCYKLSL